MHYGLRDIAKSSFSFDKMSQILLFAVGLSIFHHLVAQAMDGIYKK